jgi:hypothetical protein
MMRDTESYLRESFGMAIWTEWNHGETVAGCLFDLHFYEAYLKEGLDCYVDVLHEVPSASQIKKNYGEKYSALLSACQSRVVRIILIDNKAKKDRICSWWQLVNKYETDDNKSFRTKKLENFMATVFHRNYRGGLAEWIQYYKDTFTEIVIFEKNGMMMIWRNVFEYKMVRILD